MTELSLVIDGMLSGTGIRDAANGGYLEPQDVGLSEALVRKIGAWQSAYEDAHFHQYEDEARNEALDREGLEIVRAVRAELPKAEVGYFSSATLSEIKL
ncbi:hypothetical protein [Sphingomonas sp.]|uniref:hypothetical protein n=1 Tax=Sphingomonas sp. TaxID=28214 RepID=UPI001B092067|nr:hypothetical protein [Sphingomonas sp.]MBO9714817.1 hypothetical protein [Sphingomonas sp.]